MERDKGEERRKKGEGRFEHMHIARGQSDGHGKRRW